jgi:hypothetical protein
MPEGFERIRTASMGVEGRDEKKKGDKKKAEVELEAYRREAQEMLDAHRSFFMSFGGDISLTYKLGSAFFIDLEKGEVNLATQWFMERGYSREQILWAVLHELSHFRDFANDPERMMSNFAYVRSRARETGATMMRKWEEKYKTSDSEFIEKLKRPRPVSKKNPTETMNAVEQAAYKIHHKFWNIFDDIFVNAAVSRRAPAYERGSAGGEEIRRLYREKLFAATNYQDCPRHLQFLYALLREEMVPGEMLELGDDARAALEEKMTYLGKRLNSREIIAAHIKPGKNKDVRVGERYFALKRTLEPIFLRLLAKDLEDWEPEKPLEVEQQKGESDKEGMEDSNPFKRYYDHFAKNKPDQIDEDEIINWAGEHDKEKKDIEDNAGRSKVDDAKSSDKKAADAQSAMDRKWCEEHRVPPRALKRFRRTEGEVAPYLEELSELWERIIYGSGRETHRAIEGHFKTGSELDIQKVIDEWPRVTGGEFDEARVMKRNVIHETIVRKPELIRVRIVADLSSSMDSEKRRILEQCVVLLLSSLREFNTKLNLTREQTKSRLTVDTEVRIFGSNTKKIKAFRKESSEDEQVEIVQIFERLAENLRGTADHLALSAIERSIDEEERDRIRSGKTMDIVFEITDGGANIPTASARSVSKLIKEGFIVRSFQIGKVSEEESETFRKVWIDRRKEPLGEVVGENISNLTPAVVAALKRYLSNVRL